MLAFLKSLPAMVTLVLGLGGGGLAVGGIGGAAFWTWNKFWDNPKVYSAGYQAGYATARREAKAAADEQAQAIRSVKSQVEQRMQDLEAFLRQLQVKNAEAINKVDAAGPATGGSRVCYSLGVVRALNAIGPGRRQHGKAQ